MAAISSKVDAKAKLPTHYLLKAESGLELPSLVLLEQLRTIDKKRLEAYIGRLEEKHSICEEPKGFFSKIDCESGTFR